MILIIFILITTLISVSLCLDICKKIDLTKKGLMSIFLIILPHIAILIYLFNRYASAQKKAHYSGNFFIDF
jgi:triacylglycerol lipase